MSRYTLKTYYNQKLVERFDHRTPDKLRSILRHPRHHRAGKTGPFGEEEYHVNRFEIYDTQMEKLHSGDINETTTYVAKLR